MRAVILAGGKGTRLAPYTVVLPKPLMPIGEYPILEVIVRQLAYYDFDHITMAVNHQAEIIQAFFDDGKKWGLKIDYSIEDKPLSTMGPLKLIKDHPDDVLVMNGDILTNLDYRNFFSFHVENENIFTVSSFNRRQKNEFGVLKVNEQGTLTGFEEKPYVNYVVSMGIYMLNKKVLDIIPDDQEYGFDDIMNEMLSKKMRVAVKNFSGYWLDIGRPDDYRQAIEEFESNKDLFLYD